MFYVQAIHWLPFLHLHTSERVADFWNIRFSSYMLLSDVFSLKKTEYVDTKVKSGTRSVIKQGYQVSYELLLGRNVF